VRLGLALLAILSAALLAAVSAHVGIDILGDYLVRDDSYDHVAHGSRELFTMLALLPAAGVGVRLFSRLCVAAASIRTRVRFLRFSRYQLAGFTVAVVLATLVLVPSMEAIDAARAGVDVDSLADAFGSSMLLGTTVSLVCALIWCGVLFCIALWLSKHRESVARLLYELIAIARGAPSCIHQSRTRETISVATRERRAQRRSKRGPPRATRPIPVL